MTPPSANVFTIEAANALVPRLNALMAEQMKRRADIEERLDALRKTLGSTSDSVEVEEGDSAEVRSLKEDLAERMETYRLGWNALEDMGAVLKDARAGLVDFYGHVDGKLVWLCWRYGEASVAYYHRLDEGFSGRKPILPTVRDRHLN